jgi:imidazolonepropionase-like amidohydrolase
MIIKDPVAMKVAFGENPVKYYGKDKKSPASRLGVAALLREFLFKAKHYYEAKINGKDPAFDFKLESMLPVMSREIPLKIHAHRSDDIFTAIRIAKEFNLKYIIDHCTDGILFSEELAKENIPVCVGPSMGKKSKPELLNKSFKNPATLNAAGVKIAIVTDATVMPIDYLTLCAGLAVSVGLPEEDAWRAITISPAEIMGIADRVGSLEVGKDGNVAIWNYNPLKQIGLETYLTIGEGKVVYKAE